MAGIKLTLLSLFSRKRWGVLLDIACANIGRWDGGNITDARKRMVIERIQRSAKSAVNVKLSASQIMWLLALAEGRCEQRMAKKVAEVVKEEPAKAAELEDFPTNMQPTAANKLFVLGNKLENQPDPNDRLNKGSDEPNES